MPQNVAFSRALQRVGCRAMLCGSQQATTRIPSVALI